METEAGEPLNVPSPSPHIFNSGGAVLWSLKFKGQIELEEIALKCVASSGLLTRLETYNDPPSRPQQQ